MTTALAAAPIRRKKMTVEEYIEHEERSELRHEYDNGKLTPMAGTSSIHNIICGNLYFLLRNFLKKKGFKVFMENLKVEIPGEGRYYYPDVMVTAHPDDLASRYVMRHPVLLVEVLSDSTRIDDRGRKWADYQKLPSLQYYLMVESEKMVAELVSRRGKGWRSAVFTLPTEAVGLPGLGLSLPLADVYEGL